MATLRCNSTRLWGKSQAKVALHFTFGGGLLNWIMAKKSHKKVHKAKSKFWLFTCGCAAIVLAIGIIKVSFKTPVCANSVTCIDNLSGNFDPSAKKGVFLGNPVTVPSYIADGISGKKVLGEVEDGAKRIEVDLTKQTLYAYQNDQLIMSFPVSTGKWTLTPTGTFKIWIKLKYTRMSGGEGADYYNLPNVPSTMFFYNDSVSKGQGFSLHGAYWHNNFGHAMSHGCVNISPANAEELFNWAEPVATSNTTYASETNPGTEVIIYGKAP